MCSRVLIPAPTLRVVLLIVRRFLYFDFTATAPLHAELPPPPRLLAATWHEAALAAAANKASRAVRSTAHKHRQVTGSNV